MNKIIEKDDAILSLNYIENVDINNKTTLDNLLDSYYKKDDCQYINKIDDYQYKGDLACLFRMGDEIIELIENENLLSNIKYFKIDDIKNNESVDLLNEQ